MSNKHTFNNESIFQHFTEFIDSSMECFICLETIQNAVICPNCKKPACTKCFNVNKYFYSYRIGFKKEQHVLIVVKNLTIKI
jgi:hypothetical protein